MLRSVFTKTLRDERRALLGWGLGIALLALWMVLLYPSIKHSLPSYTRLVRGYPPAFKALFGLSDISTADGYLRAELFGFMVPTLVVIFAVLAGSDATTLEEERRTIDLLLANPIRRGRVVAEKFAAVSTGLLGIGAGFLVVLVIGAPAVGMHVVEHRLVAATVSTVLLGGVFVALAFALGCLTGRRGLSRGASAVAAVVSYFVGTLAPLVHWLKPLRPCSPYYHAIGVDPLRNGLAAGHVAFLVGVTAVLFVSAVVAFERRDLAV